MDFKLLKKEFFMKLIFLGFFSLILLAGCANQGATEQELSAAPNSHSNASSSAAQMISPLTHYNP
jgi:hypothetical protein